MRRKLLLLKYHGGSCSKCGYNKNISALDFHHIKDKLFQLDLRNLSNRTFSSLFKESLKCEVLCANCHRENHYPDMETANVYSIVGVSLEKSNDAKWMNSMKPLNMATLSQTESTLSEGAETSGEV